MGAGLAICFPPRMEASLSLDERLTMLRELDHASHWYSLDDKRSCAVCARIFSGRQVRFQKHPRTGYVLRCPTEDCPAHFSHWMVWRDREAPAVPPAGSISGPAKAEFRFF